MEELGKFLKAERQKQKLSLEDVASRTKIHIQKIRDIESGNREALPAKVFCIGLIKSYARELKVDMDRVDEYCQNAFIDDEKPSEPIATEESPKTTSTTTEDSTHAVGRFQIPKAALFIAGGILSILLIFIIIEVVEKMNAYSEEEALPQEVFQSQSSESLDTESSDESANTEMPANKESAGELTSTDKETQPVPVAQKAKPTAVEPKAPTPSIDQDSKIEKIKENMRPMDVSNGDFKDDNFGVAAPTEPTEPVTEVISDNKLTIVALEPVRAEIVWSDGFVQVMLLKSQESKTLVFSKPITLRVNNGGAIQVSFNESEKKVPGSFNKPLEIKYP